MEPVTEGIRWALWVPIAIGLAVLGVVVILLWPSKAKGENSKPTTSHKDERDFAERIADLIASALPQKLKAALTAGVVEAKKQEAKAV